MYGAAIACFFADLTELVQTVLKNIGLGTREIKLPPKQNMFGANIEFKRAILGKVIDHGSSATQEGLAFDSSDSPVLYDPAEVTSQVRNLAEAFKVVNKHTYPQSFRILGGSGIRDYYKDHAFRF
ncbi:hypothetical protein U1Q18_016297 [Sarracenia purpurea var. burkii]